MKQTNFRVGRLYNFYDNRATDCVCKAHILQILPHPEHDDDNLIVYRWFGIHKRHWWYGVTTVSQQEFWAGYVAKVVNHYKKERQLKSNNKN